jgi:hypothetical protein
VIDLLVAKIASDDAGPFQAPELTFYFLHARLWLLIALARVAHDHPGEISRYETVLKDISLDSKQPHVLIRRFASEALIKYAGLGTTNLSNTDLEAIRNVYRSPFPVDTRPRQHFSDSLYRSRPKSMPKPASEFSLDYDFEKYNVHPLAELFGVSGWLVKDAISKWVSSFDPKIQTMYEPGGRQRGDASYGMSSGYHTYGQQLGWHALYFAAGELLSKNPVALSRYSDEPNPWPTWLDRQSLTRNDGLWLADGLDLTPLETQINLLEQGTAELTLTGNKKLMMELLGVSIPSELVVKGHWKSYDNIEVSISSALVESRKADQLARRLAKGEPFHAWLPSDEGREMATPGKEPYIPWINVPYVEAGLDDQDPLGDVSAVTRPGLSATVTAVTGANSTDSFRRLWVDANKTVVARADAWGRARNYENEASGGLRLKCSRQFLATLLHAHSADLLILLKLQRYEKSFRDTKSRFSNTTYVVRVQKSLKLNHYPGAINRVLKTSL